MPKRRPIRLVATRGLFAIHPWPHVIEALPCLRSAPGINAGPRPATLSLNPKAGLPC